MRRSTWYGLSTSTPAAGAATSTTTIAVAASPPSAAKWVHVVPATNSIAPSDRQVDEPRAEVRLGDHEHRRDHAQAARSGSWSRDRPAAGCGRPRSPTSATTSSSLPSSDAWKLKNGELDRAARAAGREAERVHEQDRADHERVDAELPLAQARVVEARDQQHQDEAHRRRSRPGGRRSSSGRRRCRPGWPCRRCRCSRRSARAWPAAAAGRCAGSARPSRGSP